MLRRRHPDGSRLAGILNSLGEIYVGLREYKLARQSLEESLAIPPASGTNATRAPTLTLLVRVYAALGDRPRAREFYTRLIPSWPLLITTRP